MVPEHLPNSTNGASRNAGHRFPTGGSLSAPTKRWGILRALVAHRKILRSRIVDKGFATRALTISHSASFAKEPFIYDHGHSTCSITITNFMEYLKRQGHSLVFMHVLYSNDTFGITTSRLLHVPLFRHREEILDADSHLYTHHFVLNLLEYFEKDRHEVTEKSILSWTWQTSKMKTLITIRLPRRVVQLLPRYERFSPQE